MTLDIKVLKKTQEKLNNAAREREFSRRRRAAEAAERCPRLAEIEAELSALGARIAAAALGALDGAATVQEAVARIKNRSDALRAERKALLEAAGFPPDLYDLTYACEACADTGYVGSEPCSCLLEVYRREQAAELSGLFSIAPGRFEEFDISLYSEEEDPVYKMSPRANMRYVFKECKKFAEEFSGGENLILTGSCGLGKTFLSACIAREVISKNFSVVYESAFGLASAMESDRFSKSEEAADKLSRCYRCDLLIVDDLGTEMNTSYVTAALFDLLNTRLNDSKSVIINTNLSTSDMGSRYNEQIASRVEAEYKSLFLFGPPVRKAGRAKRSKN